MGFQNFNNRVGLQHKQLPLLIVVCIFPKKEEHWLNFSISFDLASAVSHLAFFCDELIFSSRCDLCCFREFSLGGFLLLFEFWREKPLVLDFSLFESTFFGPVLQNCISFHFRIKRFESSSSSLIQMSNGVSVVAFFAFLVGGFPEVEHSAIRRSNS